MGFYIGLEGFGFADLEAVFLLNLIIIVVMVLVLNHWHLVSATMAMLAMNTYADKHIQRRHTVCDITMICLLTHMRQEMCFFPPPAK